MVKFPDDVMTAAREAAAKEWAGLGSDLEREFRSGMRDDAASVRSAAFAIMAERQRCADIADSCDVETYTLRHHDAQVRMARRDIKAAILR
jgi:hypothetical protein